MSTIAIKTVPRDLALKNRSKYLDIYLGMVRVAVHNRNEAAVVILPTRGTALSFQKGLARYLSTLKDTGYVYRQTVRGTACYLVADSSPETESTVEDT